MERINKLKATIATNLTEDEEKALSEAAKKMVSVLGPISTFFNSMGSIKEKDREFWRYLLSTSFAAILMDVCKDIDEAIQVNKDIFNHIKDIDVTLNKMD